MFLLICFWTLDVLVFLAGGAWMLLYLQSCRADVLVPESFCITSAAVCHFECAPTYYEFDCHASVNVLELSIWGSMSLCFYLIWLQHIASDWVVPNPNTLFLYACSCANALTALWSLYSTVQSIVDIVRPCAHCASLYILHLLCILYILSCTYSAQFPVCTCYTHCTYCI